MSSRRFVPHIVSGVSIALRLQLRILLAMYTKSLQLWLTPAFLAIALALPNPQNTQLSNNASELVSRDQFAEGASNLGVWTFHQPDCTGTKALILPVYYGHDNQPQDFVSYQLNRDLVKGEQLDISTYKAGPADQTVDRACRAFVTSLLPHTPETVPGVCQSVGDGGATGSCFRLTHS